MKIILVLIVFSLSSCSTKLTNLYSKINTPVDYSKNIKNVLDVEVATLPIPIIQPQKPTTFHDLRDSLPHTYLRIIGQKADSIPQIIAALKVALSPEVKPKAPNLNAVVDLPTPTVKLLLSNTKKYFNDPKFLHPNTRLEFLNTVFALDTSVPFRIESIDRIENEFESIDFAKISNTQEFNVDGRLSGEIGAEASFENGSQGSNTNKQGSIFEKNTGTTITLYDKDGKPVSIITDSGKNSGNNENTNGTSNSTTTKTGAKSVGKAELGFAYKSTLQENLDIKFKKMLMGVSFNNKQVKISQRGTPLSDISNNIVLTLTLRKKPSAVNNQFFRPIVVNRFKALYSDSNTLILPKELRYLGEQTINYILCGNNIQINTSFSGAIRVVETERKGRNILEWDDKITYYTFKEVTGDTFSVPLNEICRKFYHISVKYNNQDYFLHNNILGSTPLIFESGTELRNMLNFLEFTIRNTPSDLTKTNNYINNHTSLCFKPLNPRAGLPNIILTGSKVELTESSNWSVLQNFVTTQKTLPYFLGILSAE